MTILDTVTYIPCHPQNRGGWRTAEDIRYLVFHYTGNDGDHDTANAQYYRDTVVYASAHYFVDDDSITQSVEDLRVAYAVGGNKWSDCPKTGGGRLFGVVTNFNSISIEMCDTSRDGALMATEATLSRAAKLGMELMKRYNIPIERVVRHFDVTGKHCPAYFMDETAWEGFKRRLTAPGYLLPNANDIPKKEEKDMVTYEKLKDVPEWYRPTIRYLMDKKAVLGREATEDPEETVIDVTEDFCRIMTVLDRLGVLGAG